LYQQDPEEDVEGALWQREAMIDAYRVTEAPPLIRKVVSIDPSGSGRTSADEVGIGVAGLGRDRHGYVLRDLSGHYSPQQWAQKAIDAYYDEKADFIVAESNFGGDMVEANIHAIDPDVPVKLVSAARGKRQRAEPIATKAAQGEIHHVGTFDELEEELCTWTPLSGWSPNRLDWCVWALTELMIGIKKGGFMSVYGPRR
jgi:phage terminase large subunit-like protein